MFDIIKMVKINVGDKNYKNVYEQDDEEIQDDQVERFNCEFESCKQSCRNKGAFSQYFTSHFTSEFTCKQCNLKSGLKNHLLLHENK